jgi:hypothetical protein
MKEERNEDPGARAAEFAAPVRARGWARAAKFLVLVFLAATFILGSINVISKSRWADFHWYYWAGGQVFEGGDLYTYVLDRYIYPPFFAVAMYPLSLLPRTLAAAIWYAGNLAALVALFSVTYYLLVNPPQALMRWARGEWGRFKRGKVDLALAITFVGTAPFWALNLQLGQINIYLWALAVLAVYFDRRGRTWAAGVFLGCACAVKLAPALIFLYFLFRRRYAAVAVAVATVVLLFLAPAAVTGWGRNAELVREWEWRVVRAGMVEDFVYRVEGNQSLGAFIYRGCQFLGFCPAEEPRDVEAARPIIRFVTAASVALLVALGFLSRRPANTRPEGVRATAVYNLYLSLIVTSAASISPFAWDAHYVVLVVPFMAALYVLKTFAYRRVVKVFCVALLSGAVLLSVVTSNLWGAAVAAAAYHYRGIAVAAILVYVAALLLLLEMYFGRAGPKAASS